MKNSKNHNLASAPMFYPVVDDNTVPYTSNAHPTSDYVDQSRLLYPGEILPRQVCQQVFGAAGLTHGSKTFPSLAHDPHKPAHEPYPEEFNRAMGTASAIMTAKARK